VLKRIEPNSSDHATHIILELVSAWIEQFLVHFNPSSIEQMQINQSKLIRRDTIGFK